MATQQPKRIRLKSLSDVQRQMSRLYREHRDGNLSNNELTSLSQHLNRLHQQFIAEREIAVSEDLLALEERLTALEEKR